MNFNGNNAEKLASTLIIFFVLLISYFLICLAFAFWSTPNWSSMVKDGMGFAVAGIAPVIAILLFNDWRDEHRTKSLLSTLESIKLKAKDIELDLKDSKEKITSRKVGAGDNITYFYETEEITQKLSDLYFLYEDLNKNESKIMKFRQEVDSFFKKASVTRNSLFKLEKHYILIKKYESINKEKEPKEQIDFSEITMKYDSELIEYKKLFKETGLSLNEIVSLCTEIKNIL